MLACNQAETRFPPPWVPLQYADVFGSSDLVGVPFSSWHPSQGIRSNYYLLQILPGFCMASWNALKGVAGGSVNASERLKHSLNPFVTLRLRFELLETAAKRS